MLVAARLRCRSSCPTSVRVPPARSVCVATAWRSRWEPIGGRPARTQAWRTTPETARSDRPRWGARTRVKTAELTQRGDLAGAQPKPRQHGQDGEVTAPGRASAIAAAQQPPDVCGADRPGQPG